MPQERPPSRLQRLAGHLEGWRRQLELIFSGRDEGMQQLSALQLRLSDIEMLAINRIRQGCEARLIDDDHTQRCFVKLSLELYALAWASDAPGLVGLEQVTDLGVMSTSGEFRSWRALEPDSALAQDGGAAVRWLVVAPTLGEAIAPPAKPKESEAAAAPTKGLAGKLALALGHRSTGTPAFGAESHRGASTFGGGGGTQRSITRRASTAVVRDIRPGAAAAASEYVDAERSSLSTKTAASASSSASGTSSGGAASNTAALEEARSKRAVGGGGTALFAAPAPAMLPPPKAPPQPPPAAPPEGVVTRSVQPIGKKAWRRLAMRRGGIDERDFIRRRMCIRYHTPQEARRDVYVDVDDWVTLHAWLVGLDALVRFFVDVVECRVARPSMMPWLRSVFTSIVESEFKARGTMRMGRGAERSALTASGSITIGARSLPTALAAANLTVVKEEAAMLLRAVQASKSGKPGKQASQEELDMRRTAAIMHGVVSYFDFQLIMAQVRVDELEPSLTFADLLHPPSLTFSALL